MSDETKDFRMSLLDHLDELRKRIIISLAAIFLAMVGCFIFKGRILNLLLQPIKDRELVTLSPTESFMTVFKVVAYSGLIVASPVIIYQVWAFVAPGLRTKERRVVIFATIFTSILFIGGVVFGWALVLPRGLDFLLNYQSDVFNQQLQAAKYFSFVTMFLLGFGVVFELPAMLLTLARLGIVSHKMLAANRKYAVLVGAVVSAVLTPGQDLFSMIAMFIPTMLLYEFSVQASRLIQKRKQERDQAEYGEENEAAEDTV
ncbi:MAG: twin-arginine translocase subunit TatC [Thermoleophilia bacterium]